MIGVPWKVYFLVGVVSVLIITPRDMASSSEKDRDGALKKGSRSGSFDHWS